MDVTEGGRKAIQILCKKIAAWDEKDEKELAQLIYDSAAEAEVETTELFTAVYKAMIGKEKGPKLALFIATVGKERTVQILSKY